MSQETFVATHRNAWRDFEDDLHLAEQPRGKAPDDFPARYRRICQHLALARHRRYSAAIIEELNGLALRGHALLYKRPTRGWTRALEYLAGTVPRAIRAEWRLVGLCHLLFYGAALAVFLGVQADPDLVYMIMDAPTVQSIEEMYEPTAEHHLVERESDSDFLMFGFYIRNNVGISFRTFAGGALVGLGSLFFLMFNGLYLGAVFGHLHYVGSAQETLYPFVVGHGSFELTAIVLSAAAGLRLGLAFLAPGNRTRRAALKEAAKKATPIVYGFATMLVVAAFIEAFWSSTTYAPTNVKYGVGALLWAAVYGWMLLGGSRTLRSRP
jgi:uncharacterized membrane protein SpoIIM required for sporulation